MYQYILFDLDGTLTDPKVGITTSVQYALHHFGIEEETLDRLEPFIGAPLKDSFMEFYQMDERQAEEAIAKYRERFQVKGIFENVVYEGIPTLLASLSHQGKTLAVASSKPGAFVERILKHFELDSYFQVVVGSKMDGGRTNKREVIEEVLRQLDLLGKDDYASVVMVGDRKFDIEGADAFGIKSIGVTFGYGGYEELSDVGADKIVTTVAELSEELQA